MYHYLRYNVYVKAIFHGVLGGTTFRNVYAKAINYHNNECRGIHRYYIIATIHLNCFT